MDRNDTLNVNLGLVAQNRVCKIYKFKESKGICVEDALVLEIMSMRIRNGP